MTLSGVSVARSPGSHEDWAKPSMVVGVGVMLQWGVGVHCGIWAKGGGGGIDDVLLGMMDDVLVGMIDDVLVGGIGVYVGVSGKSILVGV